jgi:hypothetical protein
MKHTLLGRGWQYSTYDLGNGRVFKKRNSRSIAYWVMFRSYLSDPTMEFPQFEKHYRSADKNIIDSFRKIKDMQIDPALIGHPTFFDGTNNYEQDYVESIASYLSHVSFDEAKKLIDRFIVFIDELIEIRFVDKSFNMGGNFGIQKDGSFVMTDIGEVYSVPANIQKEIARRPWAQSYVYASLPTKEIQTYFIAAMDAHFNTKNEN